MSRIGVLACSIITAAIVAAGVVWAAGGDSALNERHRDDKATHLSAEDRERFGRWGSDLLYLVDRERAREKAGN